MTRANILHRVFMDKKGRVVLTQPPNLPLIIGLIAMVLAKIIPGGQVQEGLSLVAFGALFTWAWLELFRGVNYFRRAMGGIVILLLIISRI